MRSSVLSLLACLGALVLSPAARAQGIYSYVEKDGTVVYTNVPPGGARPEKPRSSSRTASTAPTAAPPRAERVPRAQRITNSEYDAYISDAAQRYNLPQALLWAVMHTESNFNPGAVSNKGASGLMQLMPATAADMYVRDIFDVRENIEGGARYLRVLANLYEGDMVKMVAAYNAGPAAVKKHGGIPPFAETQAYVRKVIALYYQYKEQHPKADSSEPSR
jgi:soluble lytic murein transglycosylase-like protein